MLHWPDLTFPPINLYNAPHVGASSLHQGNHDHEQGGMITPCVQKCSLPPGGDACTGCGRTRDEIAQWSTLTNPQRQAVIDRLARRPE